MQRIDGIDLPLNDGGTAVVGAQVGITPLHDAVAIEGIRQTVKFQFNLPHLYRAWRDDSTPPHHAEHQCRHHKGCYRSPVALDIAHDAIDEHSQHLGHQYGKKGVEHILAGDKGAVGHGCA